MKSFPAVVRLMMLLAAFAVIVMPMMGQQVAAQSQNGAMSVLLKGCNAGVDPRVSPEKCTSVIEDDGIEYVLDTATGKKHFLLDNNRDSSGAYMLSGLSLNTVLQFNNFDPIQRDQIWSPNAFMYGDEQPWYMLYDTSRITVIFYYYDNPSTGPNSGTVVVSLRGCPGGVDPKIDPYSCTEVIEDDGIEYVTTRNGSSSWYLEDKNRTMGGDYVVRGLPLNQELVFANFDPIRRDAAFSWDLSTASDGQPVLYLSDTYPAYVVIYYYDVAGASRGTTSTNTNTTTANTGTLRIYMRTCPEGVFPASNASQCTGIVEDDGIEYIMPSTATGQQFYLLDENLQSDGSYLVTGLPLNTPLLFVNFEPIRHNRWISFELSSYQDGSSYIILTDSSPATVIIYYFTQ